jgi:alpha-tubulin suppressor-like RCC1 family protein
MHPLFVRFFLTAAIAAVGQSLVPNLAFATPNGAEQIAAGDGHACILDSSGDVYCWGDNKHGQLGDGTTTSREIPALVPSISDISAIAAGGNQTCALELAGTVQCWGTRLWTAADLVTPQLVMILNAAGDAVPLSDVTQISVGSTHACALVSPISSLNHIVCWGNNGNGELGNSIAPTSGSTLAVRVMITNIDGSQIPFEDIQTVSAGRYTTCAIPHDSSVACWGAGSTVVTIVTFPDGHEYETVYSALGNYLAPKTVSSPVPVIVPPGETKLYGFNSISVGFEYVCATMVAPLPLRTSVSCWGKNIYGELGTPLASYGSLTPFDVLTSSGDKLTNSMGVSSGMLHACEVSDAALNGEIFCWGWNVEGELGSGVHSSHSDIPVAAKSVEATLQHMKAVASGSNFSCALGNDDNVWCWGSNRTLQLGADAKTTQSNTAILVLFP